MKVLRVLVLAAVAATMMTTAVQAQSSKSNSPFWGKCLDKALATPGISSRPKVMAAAERCVDEEEKKASARGKKK